MIYNFMIYGKKGFYNLCKKNLLEWKRFLKRIIDLFLQMTYQKIITIYELLPEQFIINFPPRNDLDLSVWWI